MTTNATTAEDRLAKLGIHLPDAPTPPKSPRISPHKQAQQHVDLDDEEVQHDHDEQEGYAIETRRRSVPELLATAEDKGAAAAASRLRVELAPA